MAEGLGVRGIVTEIGIKDGTSSKGDWRKYSFNVQGHEDGQKHWYSWFNEKGSGVKTGISYYLTYTTSENKNNSDHPYRNVQTMQEIDTPANAAPEERTTADRPRDDIFRTKEELRYTESLHLATRMAQITPGLTADGYFEQQKESVKEWAVWFYQVLSKAPQNGNQPIRSPSGETDGGASSGRRVAAGGEGTISVEDAQNVMQMANDLMEKGGRKWVMDEIKKRWELKQPGEMTPEQMDIIVNVLNSGDAVDNLQAEMDRG